MAVWHLLANLLVIVFSLTFALLCFEEKKPLRWSLGMLVFGLAVYAIEIHSGYAEGDCPGLVQGGWWSRLLAPEQCIESYSYDLLLAQAAIIGSMLVWLFWLWGQRP